MDPEELERLMAEEEAAELEGGAPAMAPPPPGPAPGMGMGGPDMDPGQLAAEIGMALAAEKEQAHAMIEQASQQQLQEIMAIIAANSQGPQTADGPATVPQARPMQDARRPMPGMVM